MPAHVPEFEVDVTDNPDAPENKLDLIKLTLLIAVALALLKVNVSVLLAPAIMELL